MTPNVRSPDRRGTPLIPSGRQRGQPLGILPADGRGQSLGILPEDGRGQSLGILPADGRGQSLGILPADGRLKSLVVYLRTTHLKEFKENQRTKLPKKRTSPEKAFVNQGGYD